MSEEFGRTMLEDTQVEEVSGGLSIISLGSRKELYSKDDPTNTKYTFDNVVNIRLFILDNCNYDSDEIKIAKLKQAGLIWEM